MIEPIEQSTSKDVFASGTSTTALGGKKVLSNRKTLGALTVTPLGTTKTGEPRGKPKVVRKSAAAVPMSAGRTALEEKCIANCSDSFVGTRNVVERTSESKVKSAAGLNVPSNDKSENNPSARNVPWFSLLTFIPPACCVNADPNARLIVNPPSTWVLLVNLLCVAASWR